MSENIVENKVVVETIREETDCHFGLRATFRQGRVSRVILTEEDSYSGFGESVVIHPEDAPKLLKIIKKFIKDSKNAEK